MAMRARAIAVRAWMAIAVLAAFPCVGCDPCETSACDAAQRQRAHTKIAQGVAGVIAYRTDGCVNDCCACEYDDAELRLLLTSEAVTRANVMSLMSESLSSMTISAQHDYEEALEPGEYLLCTSEECAGLHITKGDVFTVNVQNVYGPSSLIVFGPDDKEPRDDLVFRVDQQ